ncbi:MAG: radical SAM protein [Oscillospiraceae bacterium]|nr:radical SAM protein [Oscillospiraceae bacterium]
MKKHSNLAVFIPNIGCKYRCIFCDQTRVSGRSEQPTAETLFSFLQQALQKQPDPEHIEIAFFGGSFTALPLSYIEALLAVAYEFIKAERVSGIRISTRPDAIDDNILQLLKVYGVTAIELGAQSMNDELLILNRRGHTAADVEHASVLIKQHSFSLGLQMMIGIYGADDSLGDALYTASCFIKLKPDTVRIYPTLVLEATELERIYLNQGYIPLSLDDAVSITAQLLIHFEQAGIKVIRMGLHSEMSLQQNIIAGPFHPAFGELVRSSVYKQQLEHELSHMKQGHYSVLVASKNIGAAVGLKKSNLLHFKESGYILKIRGCDELEGYDFRIVVSE